MQLKKIFFSILVVVIALTTITFGAAAADNAEFEFAVSVSGTANAKGDIVYAAGDTIDVVVDVHNNPGIAILEIHLAYDPALLAPVDANGDGTFDAKDCVAGSFLDEDYVFGKGTNYVSFKSSVTGNLTPIVDENGEIIKDGEIVKLSFKVLDGVHAKEASIKLSKATGVVVNGASMEAATIKTTPANFAVHNLDIVPGYDATCTQDGMSDAVKCKDCDYVVSVAETLPALNHPEEYRESFGAVEGNCTTPNVAAGIRCTFCGETLLDPKPGDSVAHVPAGDWIIDEEATHLKDGLKHKNCANCTAVAIEEIIPATREHNFVSEQTTAPTCTAPGELTYTCECGDKYTANIAPLGHSYDIEVIPSTCTKLGSTTYTCECGDTYTVEAETLAPHKYVMTEEESTCTKQGTITYVCECGDEYVEVLPLAPHKYAVKVVASTCTKLGSTTYTCECGDTYTVEAETLAPHKYAVKVVASTCTKLGSTTYTCECGDTYTVKAETLAPHNYVRTEEASTCTKQGTVTYACECGHKYSEKLPLAAHNYKDVVTKPTCKTLGYTTYTCDADGCGASYKADYVATLAHDYASAVTAPTCTTAGYTTYTCKTEGCDAAYVGDLKAANGHDYDSVTTAPTCTAMGYTTYTCKIEGCGEKYVANYVDAKGHTYDAKVTEPTCTAMGYTTYTCSVCADKYVADYVDAKGHTAAEIAAIEATYGAEGATKGEKCSVCDTILDPPHTIAQKSAAMIIILVVVIVVFVGVLVAFIIMAQKQVWIFKKK